jgi:glycosylphosphatidylinositol transamidase (GPIT) subunit GPI8
LSNESLLMINDLSANTSGLYACKAYNRWPFQAWYILTYCNVDSFSHGIYSPNVTLIVSVMLYIWPFIIL